MLQCLTLLHITNICLYPTNNDETWHVPGSTVYTHTHWVMVISTRAVHRPIFCGNPFSLDWFCWENLHRKPWCLPLNRRVPVNVPKNQSGWWSGTWIWFFHIVACHHPNWRTHLFQRGRYTTNQQSNDIHDWLRFPRQTSVGGERGCRKKIHQFWRVPHYISF